MLNRKNETNSSRILNKLGLIVLFTIAAFVCTLAHLPLFLRLSSLCVVISGIESESEPTSGGLFLTTFTFSNRNTDFSCVFLSVKSLQALRIQREMALSSAFEELEVLLKEHVKDPNSLDIKAGPKQTKAAAKDPASVSLDLAHLSAVLADALSCGHLVQQVALTTAGQVLEISCKVCEKNFEVRQSDETVEEGSTDTKDSAVEKRPKVLFTGYRNDKHASILTQLGAEVTTCLDSATVVVTDSLRLTSSLVGAVCKGLPITSPAWIVASKAAQVVL